MVSNGLGSPSCHAAPGGELPASGRRDCETSGFLAAAAPTDNYGLDVHIDTGLLPLSGGSLLSTVQSLLVTPEWLGLVWLAHALVVMLEWSFALDLIETGPANSLTSGLTRAQATFTMPLLALALAIAAVLIAYRGLVRREIAQTLGEAAAVAAMLTGGFWLMLDPSGTVGALSRWSDQAALGTMAVGAEGTPARPGRALGAGLGGIFAATIEAPWCYLEFGDVQWCRGSRAFDPRLRAAGAKIAAEELSQAGCEGNAGKCANGTPAASLLASARLIREAHTNGELFLALPPNGPARNSINDSGSLLRALCGTSDATSCRGTAASEAEFRTDAGTWPRVTGLLLIAVGLLGMLLLFGYVALRLLSAAAMSLFFLLLLPAAVIVPALGERGRALFRAWAARLFGAVLSKLVFAFVLGALLAVTSVVEGLNAFGWWAQWLLMSAFWWTAFLRRHQLLTLRPALLTEATYQAPARRLRLVRETLDARSRIVERHDRRREKQRRASAVDSERSLERAERRAPRGARSGSNGSLAAHSVPDVQALRTLEVKPLASARGAATARIADRLPQLRRLERAHRAAVTAGDHRRAGRLGARRERVAGEVATDRAMLAGNSSTGRRRGFTGRRTLIEERGRFLDAQAELPPAVAGRRLAQARDYPALAGLTGRSRVEYEQLPPGTQRAARLEIDRELAQRRRRRTANSPTGAGALAAHAGERTAAPPPTDSVYRRPSPASEAASRSAWQGWPGSSSQEAESPVLRDAREVAEGRKRQLGIGRP